MRSALEKAVALIGSSGGYLVRLSPKETVDSLFVWRENSIEMHSVSEGLVTVCEMADSWKKAIARKSPEIVTGDEAQTPFTCNGALFTHGLIFPIFEDERPVAVAGFENKEGDYGPSDIRQLTLLVQGVQELMRRKRAEERQRQLEAELIQAQKMEAIGTFAGGIAHDFNNILGAVTTCSELMLEETSKDDLAHEDLTHIIKAASRGKNLVKQILAFSRKSDQERQPVQMESLLNECMVLLKAFMPPTIDLRLEICAESGLVMADPTQIHQVIMNICTNAEHAMRGKNGTLRITLEAVDLDEEDAYAHPDLKPGRYSRLSVADSGSGMDPSVVKRIFDPFYTTRQQSGGTGLGLSMSHGIVKRHGGAIIVESKPGHGTVFYVLLPCAHVVKDPLCMEPSGSIPRGNERILLVDDDENVLYAEKRLLERLGYDVVSCNISLDALKRFKADPDSFDLLVTDQMMPFMTGMELAGKIIELRSDIPVILCSGFDDDSVSNLSPDKIKAAGIGGFIAKPFTRHEVGEMVRQLLDKENKQG